MKRNTENTKRLADVDAVSYTHLDVYKRQRYFQVTCSTLALDIL